MTASTFVRNPNPFRVELGPRGAAACRCRVCSVLTGPAAWTQHGLLGLYCSSRCCYTAQSTAAHQAPVPYAPMGV